MTNVTNLEGPHGTISIIDLNANGSYEKGVDQIFVDGEALSTLSEQEVRKRFDEMGVDFTSLDGALLRPLAHYVNLFGSEVLRDIPDTMSPELSEDFNTFFLMLNIAAENAQIPWPHRLIQEAKVKAWNALGS